jgi:hypothetical protein
MVGNLYRDLYIIIALDCISLLQDSVHKKNNFADMLKGGVSELKK